MKAYKNPHQETLVLTQHQKYLEPMLKNTLSGVEVKITNPWVNVVQSGTNLVLTCNKNKKRILLACLQTWKTAINVNSQNKLYEVKICAKSNHFPIFLLPELDSIRVRNYLGLKTDLKVKLAPNTQIEREDDCTIIARDKDPHVIGALCGRFLNFYKRTHHKYLDRRVFTDHFELILNDQLIT